MSINRNRIDDFGNTKLHFLVLQDDVIMLKHIISEFKLKHASSAFSLNSLSFGILGSSTESSLMKLVNVINDEGLAGGRTPLHYARSEQVSYSMLLLSYFLLSGASEVALVL